MTTIMRIALLGGVLIGVSSAVNAEPGGAVALSAEQMDEVTAGALGLGVTAAISQAIADASGSFVIAGTRTLTSTSKNDPVNLPSVFDVYTSASYGSALAANGGDPAIPGSTTATVSTDNALPYPGAIGGTVASTYRGVNGVIAGSASMYLSGIGIFMLPAWTKVGE